MNRKIKILVAFSCLIFVLLCTIQYYLVQTTYEHKVSEFKNEIKNYFYNNTNHYTSLDTAITFSKNSLYQTLAENYIENKETRFVIKNSMLKNNLRDTISQKLKTEFAKHFSDYEINFGLVLNKFVMYNKTKADTIYAEKPNIRNLFAGNLKTLDDAFVLRNYTNNLVLDKHTQLITEDTLYISVVNYESIVWKRMSGILALSVISMLVLMFLFYLALRALIVQKNINEVTTDFINNITHEFQTPLTTIGVSTKILAQNTSYNQDDSMQQTIATIERQNNRLIKLINQVLECSVEQKWKHLQNQSIEISSFVQSIISDFKTAYPTIDFYEQYNTTATLYGDAFHLTTAITNVLQNAVKYGSTKIVIETKSVDNFAQLIITDNGIGIDKKKQSLLFKKFYRINEGNIHNNKGLGLGLYYVNQIIKAHKGIINLKSEQGKGASFTISMPYVY